MMKFQSISKQHRYNHRNFFAFIYNLKKHGNDPCLYSLSFKRRKNSLKNIIEFQKRSINQHNCVNNEKKFMYNFKIFIMC